MTDRYICTAEAPWDKSKGRSAHPDAEMISDHYGGIGDNYERYTCPNCGLTFTVELGDG